MRRWITLPAIALALFLGAGAGIASATGHIEANLALSTNPNAPSPATVVLTVTNAGDAPVPIYAWATPFTKTGRLPRAVFSVRDEDGRPVRYMGRQVNTGPVTLAQFITVGPGETLQKEVDLGKEYDLTRPGWYEVSFDLHLDVTPDTTFAPVEELERFIPGAQGVIETGPVRFLLRDPLQFLKEPTPETSVTSRGDGQVLDMRMARQNAEWNAMEPMGFFVG
jgi:hypothetical protein